MFNFDFHCMTRLIMTGSKLFETMNLKNCNQSQKLWSSHPLPPYSMLVACLLAHSCPPLPGIAFQTWHNIFVRLFYENVMSLNNFYDWLPQNWWIWVYRLMLFKFLSKTESQYDKRFGKQKHCRLFYLFVTAVGHWDFWVKHLKVRISRLISSFTENDKQQLQFLSPKQ